MTVSKSNNGAWFTLTGTLAEVRESLDDEGVTANQVMGLFHNGTNYDCFYKRG